MSEFYHLADQLHKIGVIKGLDQRYIDVEFTSDFQNIISTIPDGCDRIERYGVAICMMRPDIEVSTVYNLAKMCTMFDEIKKKGLP